MASSHGELVVVEVVTPTILRIPAHFRKNHEHYYEPQLVSIGPLHRGKDNLGPMEERKSWILRDFLSRASINNGSSTLEAVCVEKMKELEWRTRRCYAESFDHLRREEFVQMMLLDGIFILECITQWYFSRSMIMVNRLSALVRSDLLKLENQIPLFVLEALFDLHVGPYAPWRRPPLVELLINYLMEGKQKSLPSPCSRGAVHHLLHLYHDCLMPEQAVERMDFEAVMYSPYHHLLERLVRRRGRMAIPCAVELHEAGVTLQRKTRPGNMFNITFNRGVLEIPLLLIEEATKSRFQNLLVFEQWVGKEGHLYFMSYAVFLDCIIRTERDVAVLQHCGIIENRLSGGEEEVAVFVKDLVARSAFVGENHYLAGLFGEVNEYCESNKWSKCRHRCVVGIKRKYYFMRNPWRVILLLVVIFVLILVVMQSFFAVYPYFRPPS